jgi:AraC-like DNA-binding protein
MSHHYYAPIRGIINLFKGDGKSPVAVGEFEFIHSSVKKTLEKNREIEAKIYQQVPIVRSDAFRRILTGQMPKEWFSKAPAQLLNIVPRGDTFIVLIFNLNLVEDLPAGATGDDVLSFFVTADHLLNGFLSPIGQAYVVELNDGKICVVANFQDDAPAEAMQNCLDTGAEKLREFMLQRYNVHVQMAMGNPCKGLESIRQSYCQAQEVLAYCQWIKATGMIRFSDINLTGLWYNYPVEMELKLINIVKMGDGEEAAKLAGTLIEENFKGMTLEREASRSFVLCMFNTFLRALYETQGKYEDIMGEDIKQTLLRIEHSHWTEVRMMFSNAFHKLGLHAVSLISGRSAVMLEKIRTYVQDHYDDPCLGLNTIADYCGLSASYLSSYYKAQTGESLANFVTLTRIEASKRLLCKNIATIAEIAKQVGYANEYSFSRAFKRHEGVSPGRYKTNCPHILDTSPVSTPHLLVDYFRLK